MDTKFATSVINENYIQHNPMVKTGRVGFITFLEMLKQMSKPDNPKRPFMRIFGDENFVAIHLQVEFMGQPKAVLDLFRIENNLLAEHWDAVEDIHPNNINPNPVVEGSLEICDHNLTAYNKQLIHAYVETACIKKQVEQSLEFLDNNIVLHLPNQIGGKEELVKYHCQRGCLQLHRVIGEGNFVLTQCKGKLHQKAFVVYDIFRVSMGLIVEHWAIQQLIPEQMAHTNGMI